MCSRNVFILYSSLQDGLRSDMERLLYTWFKQTTKDTGTFPLGFRIDSGKAIRIPSLFRMYIKGKILNTLLSALRIFYSWCHQESNRGHKDFQSFALPTELWHHHVCRIVVSITGAKVGIIFKLASVSCTFFNLWP